MQTRFRELRLRSSFPATNMEFLFLLRCEGGSTSHNPWLGAARATRQSSDAAARSPQ